MHVSAKALRQVEYDRHGLGVMTIEGFYFVRRNGRVAPAMTFDNGAEDFFNGRARSPVNGKIGYIDRSLRLRIPAKYDGGYEFYKGFALVCLGCIGKSRVLSSGDVEGSWYEGGVWACIDRSGRVTSAFRALKPHEDVTCPSLRPARPQHTAPAPAPKLF